MGHKDWVVVVRTSSQMEAAVVRGLLETNGFPVVQEVRGAKSMPSIMGHSSFGEVRLLVPPDLADAARELLEAEVQEPETE